MTLSIESSVRGKSEEMRLGLVGFSSGNGHPYSWSAIINGYDRELIRDCGFPVIGEYLSGKLWPSDFIPEAAVTHLWTQDKRLSKRIQRATKIATVVGKPEDLIGEVDAVLLARDDAENHLAMARPFLLAGLPIFIDKPFALSVQEANEILALQRYPGQIFSCSCMKYAKEMYLTSQDIRQLGKIRYISAQVPKAWDRYAVHVIQPITHIVKRYSRLEYISSFRDGRYCSLTVGNAEGLIVDIKSLGGAKTPICISVHGEKGHKLLTFTNPFDAFKRSLSRFIRQVKLKEVVSFRNNEILEVTRLVSLVANANNRLSDQVRDGACG